MERLRLRVVILVLSLAETGRILEIFRLAKDGWRATILRHFGGRLPGMLHCFGRLDGTTATACSHTGSELGQKSAELWLGFSICDSRSQDTVWCC